MIFEKLKTLNKNTVISVIGHKNPDVDSIFTSLLVVNYLKTLGFINSQLVIEDEEVERETLGIVKDIIKDFDVSNYRNPLSNNIIVIDHTKEYEGKNILGIIDHHPPFNYVEGYCYNRQACSSSCILMNLLKSKDIYESFLTKENISLFLVSGIIDCDNFRNPKTVISDKEMILEYSNKISYFNDLVAIADRDTDVSDLDYAAVHGLKEYFLSGKKVKVSYIMVSEYSEPLEEKLIDKMRFLMAEDDYLYTMLVVNKNAMNSKAIEVSSKGVEHIFFDRLISRGLDYIPMLEQKIKESL